MRNSLVEVLTIIQSIAIVALAVIVTVFVFKVSSIEKRVNRELKVQAKYNDAFAGQMDSVVRILETLSSFHE